MGEKGIGQYIKLGERIKNARYSLGMSQREFARKLGIPISTYSNYENGNRTPSMSQLQKIASALNVSVPYLMGWEDTNHRLAKQYEDEKVQRLQRMADFGEWKFWPEDASFDFFTLFDESGFSIRFDKSKNQLYLVKDGKEKTITPEDLKTLVRTSKAMIRGLLDDMMNRE